MGSQRWYFQQKTLRLCNITEHHGTKIPTLSPNRFNAWGRSIEQSSLSIYWACKQGLHTRKSEAFAWESKAISWFDRVETPYTDVIDERIVQFLGITHDWKRYLNHESVVVCRGQYKEESEWKRNTDRHFRPSILRRIFPQFHARSTSDWKEIHLSLSLWTDWKDSQRKRANKRSYKKSHAWQSKRWQLLLGRWQLQRLSQIPIHN